MGQAFLDIMRDPISKVATETNIGQGLSPPILCPGRSDQFYIVTHYIKWVTTSWADGTIL